MARSDIEVVKATIDAFGDEDVEKLLPFIHPDFESATPAGMAAEPDTYRGHEGVRRYFASFYDAVDRIWLEGRDFREVGGKVLFRGTLNSRGRSTGIESGIEALMLWTIADELLIRMEIFATEDEALASAEGGQSDPG